MKQEHEAPVLFRTFMLNNERKYPVSGLIRDKEAIYEMGSLPKEVVKSKPYIFRV